MKFKAFLKLTFISIMKNLPNMLLTFSIFPIFLGLIVGYFQKDSFTPSVETPIMSISILDEDNSNQSKNLIDFLNNEQMKQIIKTDEEEAKYELIIPKGYEASLLNNGESNIEIHVKKDGSVRRAEILGDIIDRYNEEISQGLYIEDKIVQMDISQEETKIIGEKLFKAYNTKLIENKLINTKKSLNSYEYISITFLSYMLFLVLMTTIGGQGMGENEAINNRIMSTPITKIQYFNCNQFSFYFLALFMNLLYIMAYRIIGLSFQGSLPIILLIILVQSVFVTSVSGFISVFLKRKFAMVVLYILMLTQLILGVTWTSIESMDVQLLKALATKYSPDILISSTYRNYLIYNNLDSIKSNLILIIIISLGLYLLSLLKLKWSGNYENPTA